MSVSRSFDCAVSDTWSLQSEEGGTVDDHVPAGRFHIAGEGILSKFFPQLHTVTIWMGHLEFNVLESQGMI